MRRCSLVIVRVILNSVAFTSIVVFLLPVFVAVLLMISVSQDEGCIICRKSVRVLISKTMMSYF